jgi:hypothetical protein
MQRILSTAVCFRRARALVVHWAVKISTISEYVQASRSPCILSSLRHHPRARMTEVHVAKASAVTQTAPSDAIAHDYVLQ